LIQTMSSEALGRNRVVTRRNVSGGPASAGRVASLRAYRDPAARNPVSIRGLVPRSLLDQQNGQARV
jgi:hypothetical protein